MKKLLLLLGLWLTLPLPSQAQPGTTSNVWCDSLLWVIDRTLPGVTTWTFDNDGNFFTFDATGDGVSELVTLERNPGLTTMMHVIDVQTGAEVMAIDLIRVRQQLVADGFKASEAASLMFKGFIQWTSGTPYTAFFIAKGAPVVYDPTNELVLSLPPSRWRVFAFSDYDGDGWTDIVLGDKENDLLEIHGSQFSPGFGKQAPVSSSSLE